MNLEQAPQQPEITPPHDVEAVEKLGTPAEQRKSAYGKALDTIKEYEAVEREAAEIYFGEKLAKSGEEAAIGELDLKIAAAEAQVEAAREKSDPFSEEAWARQLAFYSAMKTQLCIYCDVKDINPEFATYLTEQHPWLEKKVEEGNEIVSETQNDLPQTDTVH